MFADRYGRTLTAMHPHGRIRCHSVAGTFGGPTAGYSVPAMLSHDADVGEARLQSPPAAPIGSLEMRVHPELAGLHRLVDGKPLIGEHCCRYTSAGCPEDDRADTGYGLGSVAKPVVGSHNPVG